MLVSVTCDLVQGKDARSVRLVHVLPAPTTLEVLQGQTGPRQLHGMTQGEMTAHGPASKVMANAAVTAR